MKALTDREKQILDFIVSYRAANGYSPSHREISKGCFIASRNGVSYYINQLVIKGAIDYTPMIARSIKPKEKDVS